MGEQERYLVSQGVFALCRLSIIIVNTNTRELVCNCLESIYRQSLWFSFEVIVVDNASTDGSCEAIEAKFPKVFLLRNEKNLGFSAANNQALGIAHGEYLLLLNSDTLVLPGSLEKMIEAAESDRQIGIVAPKLIFPDGSFQMSCGPMPTVFLAFCTFFNLKKLVPSSLMLRIARSRLWRLFGKATETYVVWVSGSAATTKLLARNVYATGACLLIRRACYEEVGGLDPGYFMYVDDADYSLRVHEKGWKILYLAEATIVHIKGGTVGLRYRWTSANAYRSMLYFLKKHQGQEAFLVSKLFALTAIFFRWIREALLNPPERRRTWLLLREVASFTGH